MQQCLSISPSGCCRRLTWPSCLWAPALCNDSHQRQPSGPNGWHVLLRRDRARRGMGKMCCRSSEWNRLEVHVLYTRAKHCTDRHLILWHYPASPQSRDCGHLPRPLGLIHSCLAAWSCAHRPGPVITASLTSIERQCVQWAKRAVAYCR
jgi:hypothetical protein